MAGSHQKTRLNICALRRICSNAKIPPSALGQELADLADMSHASSEPTQECWALSAESQVGHLFYGPQMGIPAKQESRERGLCPNHSNDCSSHDHRCPMLLCLEAF